MNRAGTQSAGAFSFMPRSYLPSLLFRQTLVLALIAGACTVRASAVGVALFVMLALVPKREAGMGFVRRILKLLAAFLVGFGGTFFSVPEVPDKHIAERAMKEAEKLLYRLRFQVDEKLALRSFAVNTACGE